MLLSILYSLCGCKSMTFMVLKKGINLSFTLACYYDKIQKDLNGGAACTGDCPVGFSCGKMYCR